MARRKKLNIPEKNKGDILTSYEFNEVVEAINDISYESDVTNESVQESLYNMSYDMYNLSYDVSNLSYDLNNITYDVSYNYEEIKESINDLASYTYTYVSTNIDTLLAQSYELLGLVSSNKETIDTLLAQSQELLNVSYDHETRINSVEDLLSSSQKLIESLGITAYDIPSTNSNIQQDIDTLLAQSATLLDTLDTINDTINAKHEEAISYTETSYNRMKEYVDTSYHRLYEYVEDTTLTFTIEGLKPVYGENTQINEE